MQLNSIKNRLESWNIISPQEEGFYKVISPEEHDCQVTYVYRLNLNKGNEYILNSGNLEMNPVLIKGNATIEVEELFADMEKLDSFYIPANTNVKIKAKSDVIFYIGAAICEGIGKIFFRKFNINLPLGQIHQIHGKGSGQREVFFTLNPEIPASRLICGITWGGNGSWTSWPPHQHEKDLEEVYCYFDMDAPKFGLHLSYIKEGGIDELIAHPVRSGSMIMAPYGYHPTVAVPETKNIYLWILSAFEPNNRAYDRAILDKNFKNS